MTIRKDAIIEVAGLKQKNFCPRVKGFDSKDTYIVEARHPKTKKLLGYIRFKNGTLEFTNFKSQLGRNALSLGTTTKRNNAEVAGTHGEGFKVASLVMVRQGYQVRYEASGFYWNMRFAGTYKNMLYCFLREMEEKKLQNLKNKYYERQSKGLPRELKNNIWEDVTVKIGKVWGPGHEIQKEDFVKWIGVSLDLNQPSRTIETQHGTLIIDESFGGKIYLKGLLLEGISSTKPFLFGYNFFKGQVNRDRERLSNPEEEARILSQIWAEALQSNGKDIVKKYVKMLREDKWADVHEVADYISEATARHIWTYLVGLDPEGKIFYHDSCNGDKV